MYTVFICLGVIVLLFNAVAFIDDWIDGIGAFLLLQLLAFLFGIMLAMPTCLIVAVCMDTEYEDAMDWQTPIVALSDGHAVEGSFYLQHGRIDTKEYYYYLYEDSKGIRQTKLPADMTYIRYTDDGNCRVEAWSQHDKNYERTKKWAPLTGENRFNIWYVVYIPYGSVKEEYQIDLEG